MHSITFFLALFIAVASHAENSSQSMHDRRTGQEAARRIGNHIGTCLERFQMEYAALKSETSYWMIRSLHGSQMRCLYQAADLHPPLRGRDIVPVSAHPRLKLHRYRGKHSSEFPAEIEKYFFTLNPQLVDRLVFGLNDSWLGRLTESPGFFIFTETDPQQGGAHLDYSQDFLKVLGQAQWDQVQRDNPRSTLIFDRVKNNDQHLFFGYLREDLRSILPEVFVGKSSKISPGRHSELTSDVDEQVLGYFVLQHVAE